MVDWFLANFIFVTSDPACLPTICLYSDTLCICLQLKMSIHQLFRPKKSSATEGCETRPTARPKWWGKRRRFYPPSSLQKGREGKSDAETWGGRKGCVREMLERRMALMARRWEFGWMGGGKLGVAGEGGKKCCERRRDEKCPVRLWLFRMACCQLLMTELK